MGFFLALPILAVAAALQTSLTKQIRLLGGEPELVLLLVLAWSINNNLDENVVWAFVGGICLDLLSGAPTGASVPGMLIMVFGISGLGQQVYRIGIVILVGLVFIGTLVQQTVFIIITSLAGYASFSLEAIGYVVMPTLVYNLFFIFPVYWFTQRIQRGITRRRLLS